MALSLSLGEPRPFRFGSLLALLFNGLPANPAKTQTRVSNDIHANGDRTRGRRVARDASVNRRISGVGSLPVWVCLRDRYDDGGFSGGTLERPALKDLIADIEDGLIDIVVVYKIDRLSRALADFSKLVEIFDRHGVTFVSVTQSFNTTTSIA